MSVEIRSFEDDTARRQAVALQRAVWGEGFDDVVSEALLRAIDKAGGLTAGAFVEENDLVGVLVGISGVRDGALLQWSHLMAVREDFRGQGVGIALKWYQREFCLARGIESVYWTYEPLEARNAHLNLNNLGAEVIDYTRNMYGDGGESALWAGIGTDRFTVRWPLTSGRVVGRAMGQQLEMFTRGGTGPIVNEGRAMPDVYPDAPRVAVEIPAAIQRVKSERPEEAAQWRESTRGAFEHYLARGYRVMGLDRAGDRPRYVLEKTE